MAKGATTSPARWGLAATPIANLRFDISEKGESEMQIVRLRRQLDATGVHRSALGLRAS